MEVSHEVRRMQLTAGGRLTTPLVQVAVRPPVGVVTAAARRLGRTRHRVLGMRLDVLLEVLRPLEGLPTVVALVGLQRDMDADVRGDVIALDGGCMAAAPRTGEVQVVGALAAYVTLAHVLLSQSRSARSPRPAAQTAARERTYVELFGRAGPGHAASPLALQVVDGSGGGGGGRGGHSLLQLLLHRGSSLRVLLRRHSDDAKIECPEMSEQCRAEADVKDASGRMSTSARWWSRRVGGWVRKCGGGGGAGGRKGRPLPRRSFQDMTRPRRASAGSIP